MTGAISIAKKELRSYFFSITAYVMIALFLVIMGVIFTKFVAIYQQYSQAQQMGHGQEITLEKLVGFFCQNMAFMLCFLTPFLTMRLFAEEKRQSTLELLFTAPIGGFELVIGKFLAAFIVMFAMLALSFIYVLFIILWGSPDLGVIGSAYLGVALSMCCYLALGGLMSSFTSSQAIAAVLTFIVLIFLWLLQSLAQGMSVRWETFMGTVDWGSFLSYLSPLTHLTPFTEGLIHLKHIIYFITFTGFILFLTHRVVESNRWR